MNNLRGAMTAIVTPFKNGKVDEVTYAELIKRQIDNGIDAVIPVGTTGESATLSHNEHKLCIEIAVDTLKDSKAKVIAGAGSNSTKESIDLALFSEKAGANAVLCVTPYYNKPTQEGLYQHYKAIAGSVTLEVMPYAVPSRSGVDLEINTMIRLFDEMENINSIKEATGSLERVVALNSLRDDLKIFSGDDAINYSIMSNGGSGCISVTSNLLPKEVSDVIHLSEQKEFEKAKTLSNKLYNINSTLFIESNPIPIKTALFIAGIIPTLEFRLPLTTLSQKNYTIIEKLVKDYLE